MLKCKFRIEIGTSVLAANTLAARCLEGVRILLAEDSVDNQILFCRILRGVGATVVLANNGYEAVCAHAAAVAAGEKMFDLTIMDVRMPVMDGYEAASRLRRDGYQGPIVALTAHAVPGEEARCRAAGCSHFLTKPVDRQRFLLTLMEAVRQPASGVSGTR